MTAEPRTIYLLRIAAPPGAAGLHALRALLKRLLRQHGFRALDVREEPRPRRQVGAQTLTIHATT